MNSSKKITLTSDLGDLISSIDSRGMALGIDRMQRALKRMGNPCGSIPAIQVIGTNGKGSIASFIESGIRAAGIKTGLTTSPHLVDWSERIKTNGKKISRHLLKQRLKEIQSLAQEEDLTPFEFLLAAAFDHFEQEKVEILVLEVGLGGRGDATTAHHHRPIIAIGAIGLDHCEYLGSSIKDIAHEKVAVISKGASVISGPQNEEVSNIIEEKAKQEDAKVKWVKPIPFHWNLGIPGDVQRENAAVAKGALQELASIGLPINDNQIRQGLSNAKWPGRLQSVTWGKLPLLIDGAHNPQAMERLAIERTNWAHHEEGLNWILGIQANKNAPKMINLLLKPKDIAWIVPVPNHLSWTEEALKNSCKDISTQLRYANKVEDCLSIIHNKGWPKTPPVITGSLHLLGDLYAKELISD